MWLASLTANYWSSPSSPVSTFHYFAEEALWPVS